MLPIIPMAKRSPSSADTQPPLNLDSISEWRAWQALSVYFTVLLNRQLLRRWRLEHKCMEDWPVSQRFRPVNFLEPVPTLHKPRIPCTSNPNIKSNDKCNPYNTEALLSLKTRSTPPPRTRRKGQRNRRRNRAPHEEPAHHLPNTFLSHVCYGRRYF